MRAQDIITDDIISREKRKPSKELGSKRVPGDYFGNRKEIKQQDRDLLSKEDFKKRQQQWFEDEEISEEDPCWKNYKQVGMKTKNGKQVPNCVPVDEQIHEAATVYPDIRSATINALQQDKKVVRSAGGYFKLADRSDPAPELVPDEEFLKAQRELVAKLAPVNARLERIFYDIRDAEGLRKQRLELEQQKLRQANRELNAELAALKKTGKGYREVASEIEEAQQSPRIMYFFDVARSTGSFTDAELRSLGLKQSKLGKWYLTDPLLVDKIQGKLNVPARAWQPPAKIAEQSSDKYSEQVEEETMKQAAKNPQGARFGGYYGATQRGAPRRGQGFGS